MPRTLRAGAGAASGSDRGEGSSNSSSSAAAAAEIAPAAAAASAAETAATAAASSPTAAASPQHQTESAALAPSSTGNSDSSSSAAAAAPTQPLESQHHAAASTARSCMKGSREAELLLQAGRALRRRKLAIQFDTNSVSLQKTHHVADPPGLPSSDPAPRVQREKRKRDANAESAVGGSNPVSTDAAAGSAAPDNAPAPRAKRRSPQPQSGVTSNSISSSRTIGGKRVGAAAAPASLGSSPASAAAAIAAGSAAAAAAAAAAAEQPWLQNQLARSATSAFVPINRSSKPSVTSNKRKRARRFASGPDLAVDLQERGPFDFNPAEAAPNADTSDSDAGADPKATAATAPSPAAIAMLEKGERDAIKQGFPQAGTQAAMQATIAKQQRGMSARASMQSRPPATIRSSRALSQVTMGAASLPILMERPVIIQQHRQQTGPAPATIPRADGADAAAADDGDQEERPRKRPRSGDLFPPSPSTSEKEKASMSDMPVSLQRALGLVSPSLDSTPREAIASPTVDSTPEASPSNNNKPRTKRMRRDSSASPRASSSPTGSERAPDAFEFVPSGSEEEQEEEKKQRTGVLKRISSHGRARAEAPVSTSNSSIQKSSPEPGQPDPHVFDFPAPDLSTKLEELISRAGDAQQKNAQCVQAIIKSMNNSAAQVDVKKKKRLQQQADATATGAILAGIDTIFASLLTGLQHGQDSDMHAALAVLAVAKTHHAFTSRGMHSNSATALINKALQENHPATEKLHTLCNNYLLSMVKVTVKHPLCVGQIRAADAFRTWERLITGKLVEGSILTKIKSFCPDDIITAFSNKVTAESVAERWKVLERKWQKGSAGGQLNSSADWRDFLRLPHPQPKRAGGKRPVAKPPLPSSPPSPPLNTTAAVNISIIVAYSNMKPEANDAWMLVLQEPADRVEENDRLQAAPFDLLQQNEKLKLQLARSASTRLILHPEGHLTSPEKAEKEQGKEVLAVGEYWAQDLHAMAKFWGYVQECPEPSAVNLIYVPVSAVEDELRKLKSMPSIERNHDTDTLPSLSMQQLHYTPSGASAGNGASMSDRDGDGCIVNYAFARTWDEALQLARHGGAKLSVVSIRTLMWMLNFGTEAARQEAVQELLNRAGQGGHSIPLQYPPNSINSTYDDKAKNAVMFDKFMLPQLWMECDATVAFRSNKKKLDKRLQQMEKQCSDFMEEHFANASDDRFVLKGSHATCESAFRTIKRSDSAELRKALRELVVGLHQHAVGIQPFSSSLREREYRHWCKVFTTPSKRYLRVIATIQTCPNEEDKRLEAITADGASDEVEACRVLVEDMLTHQPAQRFWNGLMSHEPGVGMAAVRIDTWWNKAEQRAFFNELAPIPDAVAFATQQGTSLLADVGEYVARNIWQQATKGLHA